MQIAILYNTFSAKGKGVKIAQQIADYCEQHNISFKKYENDWSQDALNASYMAVVGGDGTMNYFLNRFPLIDKPIILFPGGTGNDLFWKLYGKSSIENQLAFITNCIANKTTIKKIDVAECILDNKNTKYYVNGVGLGFDGAVLESMNAIRFFGGFLGYYLVVLKNIFKFREPTYSLQIDDKEASPPQDLTIANIANASRTGGGFMISPHAEVDDGKLNLLYCNVPSTFKRLALFLKVGSGKHIHNKAITYHEIDTISISSDTQVKAQLDGELIESKTFEIGLSEWKLGVVIN